MMGEVVVTAPVVLHLTTVRPVAAEVCRAVTSIKPRRRRLLEVTAKLVPVVAAAPSALRLRVSRASVVGEATNPVSAFGYQERWTRPALCTSCVSNPRPTCVALVRELGRGDTMRRLC